MIGRVGRSVWIRALITAIVLALLLRKISLAETVATLIRLRVDYALAVLLLLALDRLVMVWRWIILLRATGQTIGTKSAVWIYLVSSFIGSFLPAGVGGDAARAYSLARRTSEGSAAVASVAVDRLLGLLSLVVVAAFGLLMAPAGGPTAGARGPLLVVCLVAALVLAAFLWSDRWLFAASGPLAGLVRLASAVGRYRNHRSALAAVLSLSIGVQLLRIAQAWLLGRGIGIEVSFSYYLLFMPVGLVALMLPISLNGFGVPQGIIVWLLRPVGVSSTDAFALSTLIVLSGILANLPGAWLYLRAGRSSGAQVEA
ncbi:MAG: lysylphosphatidylglycerol synthase transmembrane domain-containing protein [Vicinamibacterales bacterium]